MRLRIKAIYLGFLVILTACAAQSSYLEADRTRELVQKAVRAAPSDPDALKAQVSFEAGEMNLGEARYGRATDHFNEANQLAQKVLAKYNVLPTQEVPERVQKQIEREKMLEHQDEATEVEEPIPDRSSEIPMDKRMSLPAEALAKYLSMKESVPMEPEEFVVSPPKEKLPVPPAKTLKEKMPPPPKKMEKLAKEKWSENSENSNDGAKIVEASGEIKPKLPPPPPPPETDEMEKPPPPPPQREAKKFDLERKQLPGSINFPPKEVALNDQAMNQLDQLSRFLVENPSDTLILVATKGPNEDDPVVEARFASIRSYLSARGVPDDQVRLDDERKSGPNPSFEMFYIEH